MAVPVDIGNVKAVMALAGFSTTGVVAEFRDGFPQAARNATAKARTIMKYPLGILFKAVYSLGVLDGETHNLRWIRVGR